MEFIRANAHISEMSQEGAIAVTRFGLGASPGEIDVASRGPKDWLSAQLVPQSAARFGDQGLVSAQTSAARFQTFVRNRQAIQTGRARGMVDTDIQSFRQSLRDTIVAETFARTIFGAQTTAPFHERLVRFWSNHFSVSARNLQISTVAGAHEREAIRPNILGSFYKLANAAIFHQGMLLYLDSWQSIGPTSRGGKFLGRGLNENLAREVMELHTVTPTASYTQGDVTEFAKALTGWSIGNSRFAQDRLGEVVFADFIHEPGIRTVLGKGYNSKANEQAAAILSDLCSHPATAENVARKLARHFTADEPPEPLVDRLRRAFLDTDGELMYLYDVLINSPECWQPKPLKVKTPDELLTSAARLFGLRQVFGSNVRNVYDGFAQAPFTAPSPEGWPDTADAWLGPDALMKRIEWANRVSKRMPTKDAREMLREALGKQVTPDSMRAVRAAESPEQAIAIALMSPDFQKR